MADSQKKTPVRETLRRRNVQGALWRHKDSDGNPVYSLGVTRSYKKDGAWHNETLYVGADDIPKVIAVLQEGETAIYEELQKDYERKNAEDAA